MFLGMAVGNWAVMLCLGPLVVGSVPTVSWRRELLHRAGIAEVEGEILAARGEGPGGGVGRLASRHQTPVGVRAEDRHAVQVMRMPSLAPPARAPRYLSFINFDPASTRRTRTPLGSRPHASWSIFRSPIITPPEVANTGPGF